MPQRCVTRRFIGVMGVCIAMVVHGTVLHATTQPPEGAVKAELGFPSVGTTWVHKIVVQSKDITITQTSTVLEASTHDGKPVHRIREGAKIDLYDTVTGNWTATVLEGKELNTASPYVPVYAFPLWVGKSWKGTFAYNDHERGTTFENIAWRGKITAYEDMSVPVGTFKAFKVEGTDGGGVQLVLWYAPKLHIIIKSRFEQLPGHYLGPETFTSELIEYTAK